MTISTSNGRETPGHATVSPDRSRPAAPDGVGDSAHPPSTTRTGQTTPTRPHGPVQHPTGSPPANERPRDPELNWPTSAGKGPIGADTESGSHRNEQPFPPPDSESSRGTWLGADEPPWETDEEVDREYEKEQRRVAALIKKGDVQALVNELLESDRDMGFGHLPTMFADLSAAVRSRAGQDLSGLVNDTLSESTACLSLVLLRTSYIVQRRLRLLDTARRPSPDSWLPQDIRESAVPFLMQLSMQLAELESIRAATARQWRLARSQERRPRPKSAARRSPRKRLKVVKTGRPKARKERRRA